jgi:hypothetical protein
MQKVEGSNPFSRFPRKPRYGGVFYILNGAESDESDSPVNAWVNGL